MAPEIRELRIDRIRPNYGLVFPEDTIHGLCRDITSRGLQEPITVAMVEYTFEIIDGEKRWRACKKMGWRTIRAVVVEGW
jgi:ParB family chromosome partitioning protein